MATPHPGVYAIPAKAPQIHTQPNKAIHMRSQLLTLFVLVFVLAAAQVSAAEPLRVGITPNYEPLAFKREGVLMGVPCAMERSNS